VTARAQPHFTRPHLSQRGSACPLVLPPERTVRTYSNFCGTLAVLHAIPSSFTPTGALSPFISPMPKLTQVLASLAMSNSTADAPSISQTISPESQFEKELRLVKQKLTCSQHAGKSQWCWVDPKIPNAEHIPLCLNDIQIWAKYLVCISCYLFMSLF
jgi:hypothetical protein